MPGCAWAPARRWRRGARTIFDAAAGGSFGVPLQRPQMLESTALGAVLLAGLGRVSGGRWPR